MKIRIPPDGVRFADTLGPPHKTTVDDTMIVYEDFLSLVDFSVIFLKITVYDLQRCSESEFIMVPVKMRDLNTK